MERLNGILASLNEDRVHQMYDQLTSREFPDLKRERITGTSGNSDILLKETFRQSKGIQEKYRKFQVPLSGLRSIGDGVYRYHKIGRAHV